MNGCYLNKVFCDSYKGCKKRYSCDRVPSVNEINYAMNRGIPMCFMAVIPECFELKEEKKNG